MPERLKACVYTRVSTTEQANEGYSIEEQGRLCRSAIESKEWEYVGEYSDPGVSGRTLEREGLQGMISAIEAGEVEAVVIYKLDRLSRKQKDTLTLIEDVMLTHNVALVSLNETLDTSTPWGRAMIGILSSFNQMELENIQERTKMGRAAKAAKGGYIGGKAPVGYKIVNSELAIDPEEAEIVRMVFAMRMRGKSLQTIADELNDRGYKSRSGKLFLHSSVQSILRNEDIYRGLRTLKDGTKVDGTHEPILVGGKA